MLFKNALLAFATLLLFACRQTPDAPTEPGLFEELTATQTGLNFTNRLPEDTLGMNIIEYLYYYNGGGVAIGDLNNDGLPDLFFTANWGQNRLFLNKSNLLFEDITQKSGLHLPSKGWQTGCTMADVNADGWLDIYVCEVGAYKIFSGKNRLFINQKDGTFQEKAAEFGLDAVGFCTQASFFDADLDGDLDCFLLKHSVHSPASYRPAADTRRPDRLASDQFFKNEGSHFIDFTAKSGIFDGISGYGLGLVVGDVNADGLPDIFVGNDFHENDFLWLNLGGCRFRQTAEISFGHTSNFSMGCDLADANNDGLADLLSLDMKPEDEPTLKASAGADPFDIFNFKHSYGYHFQYPRNCLQLNQGIADYGLRITDFESSRTNPQSAIRIPQFSEIGQLAGIAATDWSWSPLLADFDGDGWRDLFISNGIWRRPNDLDYTKFSASENVQKQATDRQIFEKMPRGDVPNYFFKNRGDLTFQKMKTGWLPGCSNGAAQADLDGDGDPEIVLNNLDAPATILKNRSRETGANWLTINCLGDKSNPFGIGCQLEIETADGLRQVAQNFLTRGFQSAGEPVFQVGIGKNERAESVKITWPDGSFEVKNGLAANSKTTFKKENTRPKSSSPTAKNGPLLFEKTNLKIPFVHVENDFLDIEREKLMPWLLSTQGPKMAVADFDKNGLDDLAIDGKLFFQMRNSEFGIRGSNLENPAFETTALAAFDADGDGDFDLLEGAGGNEGFGNGGRPDALFLNKNGQFSLKNGSLPAMTDNAACIRPADFDGDGDLDLFVGSRSVSGNYGAAPLHFLLKNDGRGHFERAEKSALPDLESLGMVTDAAWADVNLDGKIDLIVVGEWMPMTLFLNENGAQFSKKEVAGSSGLWQSLAAGDFDGDGDIDFIGGNLGLNSNWQVAENQPISLFWNDFDGNGQAEPVIRYWRNGRPWPVASKDELVGQMPFLKKEFVGYRKFADSEFGQVFSKKMLAGAVERRAEILASCLFENDGRGSFSIKKLPTTAQFSPVMAILTSDFDGDGHLDALLGQNFLEVQPSIGRFDAGFGVFLRGDGRGNFEAVEPRESGFWLPGACRDLKILTVGKGRFVVAAMNGGAVQAFRVR